ncbi:ABC transporter ATP-binding protein [Rothia kristinae]|uniref:ABC transporter ATP-binding protein n=1 Tax=Rothia kristinae TaxID=37923 RepID=A0A7T4T3T0_9MICC|nr:ABC transporter ATP-binding protein [Rothia kristinae]MDN5640021.1 ABC transporter ATP-binding protein [Actinomycetes bacterium]QQC58907.1 ABC transporter ATP-binding protein [Rothia kristinae]
MSMSTRNENPAAASRPTPPELVAEGLELGYGDRQVVRELSLRVPTGRVTAIIGPNGCGKSTLLRGFSRLLRPSAGTVTLGGRPLGSFGASEFARTVGLLPQQPVAPDGITVADLVSRGRYPHQGLFSRASAQDDAAVAWALEATRTGELAERPVAELSGGQRQRVWIAMALAQQTDVLLLDEPTTYLDLAHQVEVLDLVVELNREHGTTVVMVLHELNLAARAADHLVAMKDGRIEVAGAPEEVLTEEHLARVFGLDARVLRAEEGGGPVVVPRRRPPRPAPEAERPAPGSEDAAPGAPAS